MPLLPRTRRGVLLLAGASWLAMCAGLWWALPVVPRAVMRLPDFWNLLGFGPNGDSALVLRNNPSPAGIPDENGYILNLVAVPSGKDLVTFRERGSPLISIGSALDGRIWILCGIGDDGFTFKYFKLDLTNQSYESISVPTGAHASYEMHGLSPDGRFCAFQGNVGENDKVLIWDLASDRLHAVLTGVTSPFAFAASGDTFIATLTGIANEVQVFDVDQFSKKRKLISPHIGHIRGVCISSDGAFVACEVASPTIGSTVVCWNLVTGDVLVNEMLVQPQFCCDGRMLLACDANYGPGQIKWFDLRDGRVVANKSVEDCDKWEIAPRLLPILKANKGLHDILHQLQRTHSEIGRLLATAAEPGFDPVIAEGAVDSLTRWRDDAEGFIFATKRLDPRRRWVAVFVRYVNIVLKRLGDTGGPVDLELDRAMTYLARLPSDKQPDLHARIHDIASNLDTAVLNQSLNELRATLKPADADPLDKVYTRFEERCAALKPLIDQQELCQLVESALREADALPSVTAEHFSQWNEVTDWVRDLAAARPDDKRSDRLAKAADLLGAADSKTANVAFARFRELFKEVFFDIDSQLLHTTEEVLDTTEVLDALLWRFMS